MDAKNSGKNLFLLPGIDLLLIAGVALCQYIYQVRSLDTFDSVFFRPDSWWQTASGKMSWAAHFHLLTVLLAIIAAIGLFRKQKWAGVIALSLSMSTVVEYGHNFFLISDTYLDFLSTQQVTFITLGIFFMILIGFSLLFFLLSYRLRNYFTFEMRHYLFAVGLFIVLVLDIIWYRYVLMEWAIFSS